MTTDTHEAKDVAKRLWAEIDHARLGMLGIISGPPRHFQPMTPFTVPEAGEIWFFTRADTDLAADASRGPSQAMFVVQAKDREIQACIAGELVVESDRARVDAWWNPMVAAWYPGGKDDPQLRLLRLACHDARVWISEAGPAKYVWEVAKANATGRIPDLGQVTDVQLN